MEAIAIFITNFNCFYKMRWIIVNILIRELPLFNSAEEQNKIKETKFLPQTKNKQIKNYVKNLYED